MQQSLGPKASWPNRTRQADQNLEPATPAHYAYLRSKSQSTTVYQYILRRNHGQVTKVPDQALHITTEYSVDSRHRTLQVSVSLHIQKPKPQASIKNKINSINYLMFTIQYTKDDRGRAVVMAMLTATTNKTHNLALTVWFQQGLKKIRVR